jgi:hypothetical protein
VILDMKKYTLLFILLLLAKFVSAQCPVTINGSDTICPGSNTTFTAIGGTGATYLWSTGQTTTTRTGLSGGTYSVTVTDNNGCTSNVDFTIFAPNPVFVNVINTINPGCRNIGQIEVEGSGGTSSISYLWNTGATTTMLSALPAGTFTVTATDINGCSATLTQVLNAVTTNPTLTPSVSAPIACFGGTASITAGAANGQLPFTYTWSGGSSATFPTNQDVVTGATAATYGITATDGGGCSVTSTVTVTQPAQLTVNADSINVLCFGQSTG